MKFENNFRNNNCENAFTLAEVLITLGIIGVVAAMTLPTVINNIQNRELETRLKKSYSQLAQVMQQVITEDYGGAYDGNTTRLINNIQKHYKKSSTCINGTRCSSAIFPIPDFSQNSGATFMRNTYKNYTGNFGSYYFNDGIIATADGSFIFFDYASPTELTYGTILIAIDVNGWRHKPNKSGHDLFAFQVDKDGKLLPMGKENTFFPESRYCSNTGTHSANGFGCTTKALTDPNYFKNLPK